MSTWIEGRVERVLWVADDRGWAVIRVRTAEGSTMVVGPIGAVADVADELPFASFEGEHEHHPLHGWQFKASGMLLSSPRTEAGIRLYLASSGVKGIGGALADRIVDHFREQTTTILESTPERLAEVPGIGAKKAAALAESWRADAGGRALSILLRGLGLSPRLVGRVRARYGDEAWAVVHSAPYRLAEEISGIGFGIADKLALGQGMAKDAPERVQAAIAHVVSRAQDEGHCHLPEPEIPPALERLDVPARDVSAAIDALLDRGVLVDVSDGDTRLLADPDLAFAEERVLAGLALRGMGDAPDDLDDALLARAEAAVGITLDPGQRDAVRLAATSPFSVITGGPGTGKTTLVKVLLHLAGARGETWSLASPTGRASRRLAEATGHDAATLHRLLEFQPGTGGFARGPGSPLESDALLIDEASMVDVRLMASVLEACPSDRPFRVVLVGDADQLPSVGPGQVLRDLVDSGAVAVARLAHVHRQGARSGIVAAAQEVHAGRVPGSGQSTGHDDFFLVSRDDPSAVAAALVEIVTRRLPQRGLDPRHEVQVLTPTRKGPLGTGALNDLLRDALNPDAPRLTFGFKSFAVGDRVIGTRNRYDLGVFNGDMGTVEQAHPGSLAVRFDEGLIPYLREDLDDLELAYAITVHKSQGSEYPAVVLVLHSSHSIMLRRNLAYTAITRARRFFCGIGDAQAWSRAVRAQRGDARHTRLGVVLRREHQVLATDPR